jgi:hypothetical protein
MRLVLKKRDVLEWVAVHDEQVGEHAGLTLPIS